MGVEDEVWGLVPMTKSVMALGRWVRAKTESLSRSKRPPGVGVTSLGICFKATEQALFLDSERRFIWGF